MRLSLNVVRTDYNGVVLYKGPSKLNGKPIVVVATGLRRRSRNGKTGEFIQTYILSDEGVRPTDALDTGADASVCGDCVHRKENGWGTCYVNVGQGPNQVYAAYLRGSYAEWTPSMLDDHFAGSIIRLGAYGDPAAVPVGIWAMICGVSAGWTGYTHQWRDCDDGLREYCMASCDTAKQAERARLMGWKPFRVRNIDEAILPGEFICPASNEAGKRLQCEDCLACHGGEYRGQVTPVIMSHGSHYKPIRFQKMQQLMRNKKAYRELHSSVAPKYRLGVRI